MAPNLITIKTNSNNNSSFVSPRNYLDSIPAAAPLGLLGESLRKEGANRENSITSSSPSNGLAHTAGELAGAAPPMAAVEGTYSLRSNGPTGFTIHGLWADYNDGTWPSCCSGKKFDAKEISTLLDALNKYWPSLSCGSSSNCHGGKGLFWEHEILPFQHLRFEILKKHGTCSYSVTGDEYNYFLTALNVYFKYNVTEVLREAGYVASNSEKYPLGGIITAIQNAFHTTPQLECSGDALQELYICFYKDFSPRDCAAGANTESDTVSSSKSCPKYISLPEYVSLILGNNGTEVSESTLQSSI
ncbi:S-like RNase [Striga asiatica]|uniref:S-like RNase n=1 Tax=Striga asiatica TaxID=4170 RepID=A0A5A7RB02_STRAF|nr:S-like RNase [Striga asiatica]